LILRLWEEIREGRRLLYSAIGSLPADAARVYIKVIKEKGGPAMRGVRAGSTVEERRGALRQAFELAGATQNSSYWQLVGEVSTFML
jgi:hypothetical protein